MKPVSQTPVLGTKVIGFFGSPDWKNANKVTDALAGLEASNSSLTCLDVTNHLSKTVNEISKRKGIMCFTIPLEDVNINNQRDFENSVSSFFVFDYCFFFQKTQGAYLNTLMGIARQKNIPYSVIRE